MAQRSCFSHQKQILTLLGFSLAPNRPTRYKIYTTCVLLLLIIYPFLVVPEIIKLKSNFDEFCLSLIFQIGYVTTVLSISSTFVKRSKLNSLLTMLTTDVYEYNFAQKAYDEKIFETCQRFIIRQSYQFTLTSICAILACLLASCGDNTKLPFGARLPSEFFDFRTSFILQVVVFTAIIILVLLEHALYSNVLVYLRAHCNCLKSRIENIFKNCLENYQQVHKEMVVHNVTWEILAEELKGIVIYHTAIIKLANDTGNIFNPITAVVFSGTALVNCLALYHALTVPFVSFMCLQDCILAAICVVIFFITSLRGEQIIDESLKLADACYDIEFIDTDIRFQKSLVFIMKICQKPLVQRVGSFQVLSLANLVGIFQTIYSYFAFLRRIQDK